MWNGAIGELIKQEADAVFAAMTIDHDRSNVVDFTNPFKPQGLSIAVKRVSFKTPIFPLCEFKADSFKKVGREGISL